MVAGGFSSLSGSYTAVWPVAKSTTRSVRPSLSSWPRVPKRRVLRMQISSVKAATVKEAVRPPSNSRLTTWLSSTSLSQPPYTHRPYGPVRSASSTDAGVGRSTSTLTGHEMQPSRTASR